jgi:hypothetical protein
MGLLKDPTVDTDGSTPHPPATSPARRAWPARPPPTPNPRLHPAAVAAAAGPAGAVVAVVAASQKKNVAALRAKVAAARSEK